MFIWKKKDAYSVGIIVPQKIDNLPRSNFKIVTTSKIIESEKKSIYMYIYSFKVHYIIWNMLLELLYNWKVLRNLLNFVKYVFQGWTSKLCEKLKGFCSNFLQKW